MASDTNRPTADREVRITNVSSISFAVIVSLGCSVYGLVSGMMMSYTLLKAGADSGKISDLTIAFVLKDMFFAGGIRFVGLLVIGFLVGWVFAGFFNILARTTGGLRIRMRDDDVA
jgi:ABC-type uncharacterized transport system permease subunit